MEAGVSDCADFVDLQVRSKRTPFSPCIWQSDVCVFAQEKDLAELGMKPLEVKRFVRTAGLMG